MSEGRGGRPLLDKEAFRDETFNRMVDISRHVGIFNHMVELNDTHLDVIFHALGDATRRRMLADLAETERSVGELAAPFDMSLAAASKHIRVLEAAGLIRRKIRGRTHICRLDPGPLVDARQWLAFYERFWTERLDALARLLDDREPSDPPPTEG